MTVVDKMARLAMIAHNGVNRKGAGNVPYIVHPHAVVALLKEWGYTEADDPVTLAVAWGHDVLEDTDTSESAIRGVDEVLGERILAGIKLLTFKPNVPSGHPEYGKLKAGYIADVARTASAEIIVVKIADRLCNTLDFMNDGKVEHARAYLGYGEPLQGRIKDCRYAEAIANTWRRVQSRVSVRDRSARMENPVALRRWRESDADALFALASVPIVGQMARFPTHASKEESLRVIREIFCKPEFYAATSREDGTVLGCISLHPAAKGVDVYEAEELTIGYWMGKPYWGKGYMTEAVKALCDRCRSSGLFACSRIIGFTSTDNAGSLRVMEKAGFRHVETKDDTVRYVFEVRKQV